MIIFTELNNTTIKLNLKMNYQLDVDISNMITNTNSIKNKPI